MEEQILEWSRQYKTSEQTMEDLHNYDTSINTILRKKGLAERILHVNSEIMLDFLEDISLPESECFRATVLYPTPENFRIIFDSHISPFYLLGEKEEQDRATWLWDKNGKEFYKGPNTKGKIELPSYVTTVAFPEGFGACKKEMASMLKRKFFIYEIGIGTGYDTREEEKDLSHKNVGVGDYRIWYVSSGMAYNLNAGVGYRRLERAWENPSERKKIEKKIQKTNALFFKRAEDFLRKNLKGINNLKIDS